MFDEKSSTRVVLRQVHALAHLAYQSSRRFMHKKKHEEQDEMKRKRIQLQRKTEKRRYKKEGKE